MTGMVVRSSTGFNRVKKSPDIWGVSGPSCFPVVGGRQGYSAYWEGASIGVCKTEFIKFGGGPIAIS